MKKIVMFSDLFLPTFPYLEIPMYEYIRRKEVDVVYVLQDGDIRLTDQKYSGVFREINAQVISKPKHLPSIMQKGDVLLMRFAYKLAGGDAGWAVKRAGHKILMYDPSGIDIRVRACPAQYITSKSEALKKATLKKFPGQYKDIFVTGTIHNDRAAVTFVNRKAFMESYGMDPDKRFVILTPANPGEAYMNGIIDDYKKIVNIVREKCPNYEIAMKCHPMDYLAKHKPQPGIVHKNQHYSGKHSWEIISPGIKVIKAKEGYMALKACDAVLNIRSSIAMETALFRKPLININRSNYTTNWPFDPDIMMDIEMDELAYVLNTNNYVVDEDACLEYIKKEAYSDDGKAYVRTADIAIKLLGG